MARTARLPTNHVPASNRWGDEGESPEFAALRHLPGVEDPDTTARAMAFWRHVAIAGPDDCWMWKSRTNRAGYGVWSWGGHHMAHRAAWELANGRPVADGLVVRHRCDVKGCVNPAHLDEGTQFENVQDARERNRMPGHILTDDEVRAIRASTDSLTTIARKFQTSVSYVCCIRSRRVRTRVSP